jgi:hypothetical protein
MVVVTSHSARLDSRWLGLGGEGIRTSHFMLEHLNSGHSYAGLYWLSNATGSSSRPRR